MVVPRWRVARVVEMLVALRAAASQASITVASVSPFMVKFTLNIEIQQRKRLNTQKNKPQRMKIVFYNVKTPFSVVSRNGEIILSKNAIPLCAVPSVWTNWKREGDVVQTLVAAVYIGVMEAICRQCGG